MNDEQMKELSTYVKSSPWSASDIYFRSKEREMPIPLSVQDCKNILDICMEEHMADIGINWDNIDYHMDAYVDTDEFKERSLCKLDTKGLIDTLQGLNRGAEELSFHIDDDLGRSVKMKQVQIAVDNAKRFISALARIQAYDLQFEYQTFEPDELSSSYAVQFKLYPCLTFATADERDEVAEVLKSLYPEHGGH